MQGASCPWPTAGLLRNKARCLAARGRHRWCLLVLRSWGGLVFGLAWTGMARAEVALLDGMNAKTSLRATQAYNENPNNKDLYGYNAEVMAKLLLRETISYRAELWRAELSVFNLIQGSTDKGSIAQAIESGSDERHRSPKLERHWHDSHTLDAYLTVDRANIKGSVAGTEIGVGRLAIDQSVMTLFTPNDLFAPFRPYNYYREYKPGVDAVRLDRALGDAGRIAAFGVLGYESEQVLGKVGKEQEARYSAQESAVMARATSVFSGFGDAALNVGVFGGRYGQYHILGYSLESEWRDLGLKAEGHQKRHESKRLAASEVALGFDYRPWPALLLQCEAFFNGEGYGTASEYERLKTDSDPPLYFIGRNYLGLGGVHEITPLLKQKAMVLANVGDRSALLSWQGVLDVAESTEVSLSLLRPVGRGPSGKQLRSEYGAYPSSLKFEASLNW